MSAVASPRVSPPPRARPSRPKLLPGLAAAGAVALAALWISVESHGGKWPHALPDTLRAGVAGAALFAVCGYAPARLLAPRALAPHLWLLVLPLGAVCSSLALSLLGFLHVPFVVALVLVLAAGGGGAVATRLRLGPLRLDPSDSERSGARGLRLAWPLYLAAVVAALTLLPMFRVGIATVIGENPDSHLVVGAAEIVRKGPPTAVHTELGVDRVSPYWRSKYPIFYSLAAVSELSGLDPIAAFATLSALILALLALGFFLFAFHALRAGPRLALAAMALVAVDRVVTHVVVEPFYNQLWGTFALPFALLFGFRFVREPTRKDAILFGLFLALGAFAYPLMLPFPAVAIATAAFAVWRRRRAAGEPPGWVSALGLPKLPRVRVWVPLALLALPAVAVLMLGVTEKAYEASKVLAPGADLSGWSGNSPDFAFHRYFGLLDPVGIAAFALVAVGAAAVVGLTRARRSDAIGLAVMALGALLMGSYFQSRAYGEYLAFKTFAFLGPVVLCLAVVGLGALLERRGALRALGAAGLALLVASAVVGQRVELATRPLQVSPDVLELRDWSGRLPTDASVRIDIRPGAYQLWAGYMLAAHPVSARLPVLNTTYPHAPQGRKADYVLSETGAVPVDATGPPLSRNGSYALYRMDPSVTGPDVSSRKAIQGTIYGAAGGL